MNKGYIKPQGDNWLVVLDASSNRVSLPAYLKISYIKTDTSDKRTYFTVDEGKNSGKQFSVKDIDYLSTLGYFPYRASVTLYYSKSDKKLYSKEHENALKKAISDVGKAVKFKEKGLALLQKIKSQIEYEATLAENVVMDETNKIPNGRYRINLPDAPHRGGQSYSSSSNYATTWFLLGTSGDRYLHCGRVSAGCVTVPPTEWTALYQYLATCRGNGGVGTLVVEN